MRSKRKIQPSPSPRRSRGVSMAAKKKGKGKSKKAGPSSLFVSFEVLQNGAALLHAERLVKRRGSLTLSSAAEGALVLPYYPLPNHHLEFIRFEKGVPILLAAHKWEGFCTSKGELID